ncbi:hypothetical protein GCM10023350_22620 [Nocardioides endophyticus]|uniref:HupE/UreJ family protein n=1 Tax=Nocardioides endophyticus TaxID=1353775 RepID=A0ABP8YT73_9ACTN
MSNPVRRAVQAALAAVFILIALLLSSASSLAHGFSSVVYVDVTSPESGHVRTELGLEYDLLVVSAADAEGDDPLFQEGDAAFQDADEAAQVTALDDHADTVLAYVTGRFGVSVGDEDCTPTQVGGATINMREGVPYAFLVLDYTCPASAQEHEIRSGLFPDDEGYVKGTKTIVTYDLDLRTGSAALDADQPSFSTHQSTGERFWEFFKLGAEHLLLGLDHILFLLALIAGSRRLREIVLAATTFTIAHSVTFVLAALGLVDVPSEIVEPIIALSIAVVAGWYLWRLWRRGSGALDIDSGEGHLSLDRAGWTRLGVVFCFGLVHGLGFAGALGIDVAWSWTLLWSLLVFNIGIEFVQLSIIVLVFPLLALLRHRAPTLGLWVTGAIAAAVSAMGLFWFAQRVLGL